ncbi:MAG: hypothetical protein ACKOFZ_00870 [Ilumatobacteraceae bacterium]
MARSKSEHLSTRQQVAHLFCGWASFVSFLMVLAGHEPLASGLAALMVAVQFTAGFILWQALTGGVDGGFIGATAFGAIFGSLLSTISGIVFVSTPVSPIAWLVPPVIALPLIGRLNPIERASRSVSLWLFAATLVGLSTEWTWLLPLALGAVLVAARKWLPRLLLLPVAAALGVAQWWLIDQRSSYWSQFRQGLTEVADYSYLEAVARGTALWAHTDNVLMAGTRLGYHWISYAWAGRITETVGSTTMAFSSHVIQICFVAVSVVLTYETTKRLGSTTSWGIVAAFTMAMVVGVPMGIFQVLSVHSPSQPFVTAVLLGTLLIISSFASMDWRRAVPALALLVFGVVGGKISAVPALLAGAAVFAAIHLRGRRRSRAIAPLVLSAVVVAGGFVYFYGSIVGEGETGALRLSFFEVLYTEGPLSQSSRSFWLTMLGLVATLGGLLAVVPGLVWIRRSPGSRSSSLESMLLAAAVASLGIGLVYVGESSGVPYFFNIGLALLVPVSTSVMARRQISDDRSFAAVVVVGVVFGVVIPNVLVEVVGEDTGSSAARSVLLLAPVLLGSALLFLRVGRWRSFAAVVMLAASLGSFLAWVPRYSLIQARHGVNYVGGVESISGSPEVRRAAIWLRENSDDDDVVAVNRFCNSTTDELPGCEAYWNVVSSISGRRMYVENLDWTARSATGARDRAREVERFVDDPTERNAEFLETANVSWVFVDKAVTAQQNWEPWAEVKFENEDAMVLRVTRQGASG